MSSPLRPHATCHYASLQTTMTALQNFRPRRRPVNEIFLRVKTTAREGEVDPVQQLQAMWTSLHDEVIQCIVTDRQSRALQRTWLLDRGPFPLQLDVCSFLDQVAMCSFGLLCKSTRCTAGILYRSKMHIVKIAVRVFLSRCSRYNIFDLALHTLCGYVLDLLHFLFGDVPIPIDFPSFLACALFNPRTYFSPSYTNSVLMSSHDMLCHSLKMSIQSCCFCSNVATVSLIWRDCSSSAVHMKHICFNCTSAHVHCEHLFSPLHRVNFKQHTLTNASTIALRRFVQG